MSLADREMTPLLGGESRYGLKALEPAVTPFEDRRAGVERIGAASRANARGRQKGAVADLEELGVLSAAHRQALMLDKSCRLMPVDDERNIAVAAVHVGGLSGDVFGELRDRQIELPLEPKRRHGARTRGVELLPGA